MIEVYHVVYEGKIVSEVSYYILINNRGLKRYYETVYELVSDVDHYYSKYRVEINGEIRHKEKIENDAYRFTPILFSKVKQKRRLAVLSKFVLFLISITNSHAIYELPKEVRYHNNGNEVILSPHAFVNSTYRLIPLFEQIYR